MLYFKAGCKNKEIQPWKKEKSNKISASNDPLEGILSLSN
jgi:hypothetical protein